MVRFAAISAILLSAVTTYNAVVAEATSRRLSFDSYAGYLPSTQITDIAAIDLDQLTLNEQLSGGKLNNALSVYKEGGHSGSYALLGITNSGTSDYSFVAGAQVTGVAENGQNVTGVLMSDVTWGKHTQQHFINVKYSNGDSQATYVDCQVGGLYYFHGANRGGCFKTSGSLTIVSEGVATDLQYKYDERIANNNTLTLQSLSTNASTSMRGPFGVYYTEYQIFLNYYGDTNYGDKWITAAAQTANTNFQSGRGDSDFSLISSGRSGPAEAMKKGAAYLNIWMEVVRELNEAVTGCKGGIDNAVQSVDEAVAFYTGSLTTQENETGILLYALAEVRGNQMRTDMGDKDLGLSYVNVQVMNLFSQLQSIILARDQSVCDKAEETKNSIITLMKVPLVQGLLRYAYIREFQNPVDGETAEVVQAEGATFAATVLPFVYNCDAKAASVIHDNMQMGAQTSFRTVKAALENTYECMRITCQNVGGIWNHTAQSYNEYGSPCGISTQQNSGRSVGSYLGITVGVLLAGWAFIRYRHKFGRKQRKNKSVPYVYTGNIAAVTEIA